jgi:hypothetical protein
MECGNESFLEKSFSLLYTYMSPWNSLSSDANNQSRNRPHFMEPEYS